MILNRALESARLLRLDRFLLRRRGRARSDRAPLVLIPGMFGTRLRSEAGRLIWGDLRSLYGGPSLTQTAAHPAGLLLGLPLVPGVLDLDIHGGLVRFLAGSGGYRLGEDLFVLDYDWRSGVVAAAGLLADLVASLRGAGEEKVDLLAISTGGSIARTFLAFGADDPRDGRDPSGAGARCVRRVVYVGSGQRGNFDAIACLHRGYRFAPGGKLFSGRDAAESQTTWDALPRPEEPLFVDERGAALDHSIYDLTTWERLGLRAGAPGMAERLDLARRLHDALAKPAPHPDAVVIGARHLPTPCRIVVERGRRGLVPPPQPRKDDPYVGFSYTPGDGELSESSLRAVPGLPPSQLWFAKPRAHARLPADPEVHRLVLEALLATDRAIPETSLLKSGFRVVGQPVR